MKKILRMMGVLLALGMLFVGCAQPKDETKWNKATIADFEGDLSWIIGTWKVSFEGYTAAQEENFKQIYKDRTATNDSDAEAMANDMKVIISTYEDENFPEGVDAGVYINDTKTKIRFGGQSGSIKSFVYYTKQ